MKLLDILKEIRVNKGLVSNVRPGLNIPGTVYYWDIDMFGIKDIHVIDRPEEEGVELDFFSFSPNIESVFPQIKDENNNTYNDYLDSKEEVMKILSKRIPSIYQPRINIEKDESGEVWGKELIVNQKFKKLLTK